MNQLTCLELSIVLWFVHIATQGAFAGPALGLGRLMGARDTMPAPSGRMFPRATRALANYIENLAPFIAADLGLIVTQHDGTLGANIWIVARIVYLPLYMAGVPVVRTICWIVSLVGLVMMVTRLVA